MAKNRIDISAEKVIADTAYNTAEHNSHQSDLKVGMFYRIISPIIDLVNSVEKSVKDKDASDRVKAAQLMGLAAQGYNLNHALNHDDKAVLFRAEMGVGLAHSRQRQHGENQESIGNLLNAKEINVEARSGKLIATQTDFTSRDENGKRLAGSQVNLSAKEGIDLLAGESRYKQVGKNQSYGTEVGTAFSVGAKTGWSFYAKEGFSKGKQESEGKSYQNSHIDTEVLRLKSGGDVNLIGATAKAKSIHADIKGDLKIESLQDEHKQNSHQFGLGSQFEFGFTNSWNFSLNASAEGGSGNVNQVVEQSGLFAEEGGYHINANNVHLKGGAIASTNLANSELTTNKLTFEDIQNSSSYSATSGAISGGYSQSGSTSVNPSIPMHEQGNDNSITKATLTEGKITLNKDSQPTETTAAALGINTDISQANKQVKQPKDVNQLLKEQNIIRENVGHIATAASNFSNRQAKEAEAEKKKAGEALEKAKASGDVAKIDEKQTAYNEASIKAEAWGEGGSNRRKVDATVAVVGAILAGKTTAQTAVAAVSPELNAQIHEITKDSKTANLFAHAALSAAEFYAVGLDPASGALAGVVGEGSAMLLAEKVFNKQPNELTAEEKGLLKLASQLAGAIAGGVAGNSTATAVEGMATAKRAVENNYLSASQIKSWLNAYDKADNEDKEAELISHLNNVDKRQTEQALATRITKEQLESEEASLRALLQDPTCLERCQSLAVYSINQLQHLQQDYDGLLRSKALEAGAGFAAGYVTFGAGKAALKLPAVQNYLSSLPYKEKIVGAGLSMGANAGYQQYQYGEIKASDVLWAGGTAFASSGTSFLKMNAINAGSSVGKAYLEGEKPVTAGISSVISSSLGYGVGKIVETGSNRIVNKEYFKDKTAFEYIPIQNSKYPFISKYRKLNDLPSIIGNTVDSTFSEVTSDIINKKIEYFPPEKQLFKDQKYEK